MSPSLSLLASHPWTYTPCLLLPGYYSELAHIEAPPAGLLRGSAAGAAPAPTAHCEEAHVTDLDRRRQVAAAAAIVAAKRAEHVQPRMPWETPRAISAAVVAEWRALISLRQLVAEANQCATRAVSQGQFERARSLLGPALDAMRSLPPFCPPPLKHALSGLNAATLCGLHVAAGRPTEAVLVGEHALAMEAARGGCDNPVGLRLGMAAAQAAVGSVYAHERAVVLLQQAASTGLQQLRRLEHTGPPAPAAITEPRRMLPPPEASPGVRLTVGASPRRATRNATTASPRAAAPHSHPSASHPRPVSAHHVCAVLPSTACTGSLSSTPKANATAPGELSKAAAAAAPGAAPAATAAAAMTATARPATPRLREDLMLLPASPMPPKPPTPPMPAARVLAVDGLDIARRQQLHGQLLRAIVLVYHQTALSLSALGRPAHAAEAQHQAARLCRAAGGAASDLLRPMQGALRATTRQAAPYRPDRPSDWFAMAPPPTPPPLHSPPPSPLEQLLLAEAGKPTNHSALPGGGASRRPQTARGPAAGAPAHPAARPMSACGPFDGARRPAPGFSVPPRSPRSPRSPRRAEGQGVAPAALQQARGAGGFRNVLMPAPAMPGLKEVAKGHRDGHPWRMGPKGLQDG